MTALEPVEPPGAFARRAQTLGPQLVIDPACTFEEWQEILRFCIHIHENSPWWVADALNAGERLFGEVYAQAVDITDLKRQTLYNYAAVAARIPASTRRTSLHFAQHALVAFMEPSDRERWLDAAEENQWNTTEMRQQVHAERNGLPEPDQTCRHEYVCTHCGTHL